MEVSEKRDVFKEKHYECRVNLKDWKPSFGTYLPKVLGALHEAGLFPFFRNLNINMTEVIEK